MKIEENLYITYVDNHIMTQILMNSFQILEKSAINYTLFYQLVFY